MNHKCPGVFFCKNENVNVVLLDAIASRQITPLKNSVFVNIHYVKLSALNFFSAITKCKNSHLRFRLSLISYYYI